ncbi:EamA family transporter [Amycolatopsis decaplanina]|uniref:EamA family transporter n=1 Tax=Amycolatopsis decaplanina TaxID=208441 RepID=UPI0005864E0B|nr:EamA family transporter [Amycolatopsis decaplanina]
MIVLAVLLVLVAAFAHAGWNVIAKRMGMSGSLFVFSYMAVGSVLVLPLGIGTLILGGPVDLGHWVLSAVVGTCLQLSYYLLLQRAYRTSDLSVVYPLSSGAAPVFAIAAAVLLLGERPSPLALLGAATVIGGVLVITVDRSPGPIGRAARVSASGFGVLIGLANALATLWDKNVVSGFGLSPLLVFWGVSVGEVLVLAPVALARTRALRELWSAHRREIVVVGTLVPTAYVLVLFAIRWAPVSVIAPVKELSIVTAVIFGWYFLGEGHVRRRVTGALVVMGGVAMLTFA